MNETSPLSEAARNFKPGVYKHFKGGLYEAFFVARSSEARDKEYVVYKSLEKGFIWIRPLKMFTELIEKDGYSGPRFVLIDESV